MAEQRRHWFQLSLTTCTLMMVVAGGLVWANISGLGSNPGFDAAIGSMEHPQIDKFGWPILVSYKVREGVSVWQRHFNFWSNDSCLNFLFALAILAATAFACEYLIRLRDRKQQDPQP